MTKQNSTPVLRVLSLGAGVQSTTLALMASAGEISAPDHAVFADTGWEPRAVYEHLDQLIPKVSFPVHVVQAEAGSLKERLKSLPTETDLNRKRFAAVPFYVGEGGMGVRQCTKQYKLQPIRNQIKDLLGITGRSNLPPGSVECWIGISIDEAHRMKPSRDKWMVNRWPLIELSMSRIDCIQWLERAGHAIPPRSSCLGCPYHSDQHWADMRDNTPDEWQETVELDRMIRNAGPGLAPQFMHQARVPLDEAPLLPERAEGQMDLFGNECEGICGT